MRRIPNHWDWIWLSLTINKLGFGFLEVLFLYFCIVIKTPSRAEIYPHVFILTLTLQQLKMYGCNGNFSLKEVYFWMHAHQIITFVQCVLHLRKSYQSHKTWLWLVSLDLTSLPLKISSIKLSTTSCSLDNVVTLSFQTSWATCMILLCSEC